MASAAPEDTSYVESPKSQQEQQRPLQSEKRSDAKPAKQRRSQTTPPSTTPALVKKEKRSSKSQTKRKTKFASDEGSEPTYQLSKSRLPLELDAVSSQGHRSARQAMPGMVAHAVGGVVGTASLGAGLAIGKMMKAVSGHGIADSSAFNFGGDVFLRANGIFPTVLFEKDGTELDPLCSSDERLEALRATPMLVANHVSYLDALVLPLTLGFPRFMAKSEIKGWPIFGALSEELDAIWVDRNDVDSREKALKAIADHAAVWEQGQRPLLVFPEGTTSNGKSLLEFRKGAFTAGLAVRPVLIKYTGAWDPSNPNFKEAVTVRKSRKSKRESKKELEYVPYTEKEWAMQFAGHFSHTCTIVVCQAYEPSAEECADPVLYAANVRDFMLERLTDLHEIYDVKPEDDEALYQRWRERREGRRRTAAVALTEQCKTRMLSLIANRTADGNSSAPVETDVVETKSGSSSPSLWEKVNKDKLRLRKSARQAKRPQAMVPSSDASTADPGTTADDAGAAPIAIPSTSEFGVTLQTATLEVAPPEYASSPTTSEVPVQQSETTEAG